MHCNWVALRKESVDRNSSTIIYIMVFVKSLSARRAWIEIIEYSYHNIKLEVALRKESVDRNFCLFNAVLVLILSLSARRAWIEIWSP